MDVYKSLAEYQEEIRILKERIAQTEREFENYKIRSAKELSDLKNYAGEDVIKSVLPVLDDLERAMKAGDPSGLSLILEKFKRILGKP